MIRQPHCFRAMAKQLLMMRIRGRTKSLISSPRKLKGKGRKKPGSSKSLCSLRSLLLQVRLSPSIPLWYPVDKALNTWAFEVHSKSFCSTPLSSNTFTHQRKGVAMSEELSENPPCVCLGQNALHCGDIKIKQEKQPLIMGCSSACCLHRAYVLGRH